MINLIMKELESMITSSIFGNVIGIVSLIIGIVGLHLTIKTMKTALRTEEAVIKAKHDTANTIVFRELKKRCIPQLEKYLNDATKVSTISHNRCNNVLALIGRIRGQCINEKDNEKINECFCRLSGLYKENDVIASETLIDIITTVINIMEKGDNQL